MRAHGLAPRIDDDVCYGSGSCIRLAPTVFALGEDGTAYVLDPTSADAETLRAAEEGCPSGAITIEIVDA